MSAYENLWAAVAQALSDLNVDGPRDHMADARAATDALLHALAANEAVQDAITSRVNWSEHDHTHRPCCLRATLGAIANLARDD